jgi:uncharacterized phage protein (TIGR01671 family)
MREIKFRLYHKILKKFIEPCEFCVDGRGLVFLLGQYKPDPAVTLTDRHLNAGFAYIAVDRYTGLKDKKGKEIYEGDIIYDGVDRRIVKFYPPQINVSYGHGDCTYSCYIGLFGNYGKGEHIEIIGNIYETPELLNAAE